MLRIKRSRFARPLAAALFTFALAGPALAHDWNDGHDRGYPVHRHGDSCDRDRGGDYRDWHRGDRDRGRWDGGRWDRGNRGRDYRDHRASYGCRPCGRRWNDRDSFYRHLSQHHHVSPYWAPRVLVQADWGWLFRG